MFGDRLALAQRYTDLLATTGISHGLIGPREAPRLWERHLVNCALLEPLVEYGSTVVDIGSGAGLPGLVLAIVRPDLQLHLVEPLLRRTTWLESAIADLGLTNVTVHRGRAEEMSLLAPVVTARAVASLDKLVTWSFPLLRPGGRLLALKGAAAQTELEQAQEMLTRAGVVHAEVHVRGADQTSGPIRVVEITRPPAWKPPTGSRSARAKGTPRAGGRTATRGRRTRRH